MANPSRAVFYICSGGNRKYYFEAEKSAASVKEHLGLPCFLFMAGGSPNNNSNFDEVFPLRAHKATEPWFLQSTHYFVEAVDRLFGFDQLMYLDTDTFVCCECGDIFDVLENYDLAICQSPQRDVIPTAAGTPPSFTTLEIGVQVFRNTEEVRATLRWWLMLYKNHVATYGNTDQAAFRDVLWMDKGIRWVALPPEYGLRYQFGAMVNGKVRILHGHAPRQYNASGSLDAVCKEINETDGIRVWRGEAICQG